MRRVPILVVGLLMLAAACGDGSGGGLPTMTTLAVTTTSSPTTTTSTTLAPTTTTVPPTTTTALPATTTLPLPDIVFRHDGLGFAMFGDPPANVLSTAEVLWGPPDDDTGWLPSDNNCPGDQYRKVTWNLAEGTIWLLFTDADYIVPTGVENFTGYGYVSPTSTPLTNGPPDSIDVGVTVETVLELWPEASVLASEFTSEEMFIYTPGFSTGLVISGRVTGLNLSDLVVDVYGGRTCLGDEPGSD
jgi:hypothetical protein